MMKKVINAIALAITCFWLIVLTVSIFGYFLFDAPSGTEPLDAFMTRGVYIVFALVALMGALSSVLFKTSFKLAVGDDNFPKNKLKKIAFGTSVFVNVLCYIIIALLFSLIRVDTLILMLLWLLCVIANAVMLCILRIRTRKLSELGGSL